MTIWKKFRAGLTCLVAGATLILTGCDVKDDQVRPDPVAFVSLYNASPDAPNMDIIVDNRQINSYPFQYADHTGYLRFYTGQRNLKFGPFGASNIVIDTTVTFEEGMVYSIFVVDEYQDAGIILLRDDAPKPGTGKAKVRFLNLSPDAGDVSLKVKGETINLFENQPFKGNPEFKEVDAKEFDFQVTSPGSSGLTLEVPDINLQDGYFYTILVRGYRTPPGGNANVISAEVIVD